MGGKRDPLEEGKDIFEAGQSVNKDMSVVKHVVILLGSGDSISTLPGYGLAVPFSKNSISFLLQVSNFYTSLKVQFNSHLLTLP